MLRPRGPGDFAAPRAGGFLVGEAAGFMSPTSLAGISMDLWLDDEMRSIKGISTTTVAVGDLTSTA